MFHKRVFFIFIAQTLQMPLIRASNIAFYCAGATVPNNHSVGKAVENSAFSWQFSTGMVKSPRFPRTLTGLYPILTWS